MLAIDWYADRATTEEQKGLLYLLHEQIITTLPQVQVTIKWNVPMYTYIRFICYINYHKSHLYLSFTQGKYLTPRSILDRKDVSSVAKYHIYQEKDIYESELIEILLEAEALQESLYNK